MAHATATDKGAISRHSSIAAKAWSTADAERAAQLRRLGHSIQEIADALGCKYDRVRDRFKRYGDPKYQRGAG